MRKTFLAALLATFALAAPASAENYPSHPITVVVPFSAGGPTDAMMRILGERMKVSLGEAIVIENTTGAGGSIGVGRVAHAAPDGYTISIGHLGTHVANGAIYKLNYDLVADLEPIALLPSNPLMISARKEFPAANLKDLLTWLKDNPDKARTGNVGPASGTNVNAIYFQNTTGTRLQFVPHKSVQTAIKALASGELDLLFDQASNSLPHLRAGAIKAYAVTSKTRTVSAPEVPTTDEGGLAGFYSANWYGLWAPKGTPKEVLVRVNRAVVEALADPALGKQLSSQGLDLPPPDQRTPEALAAFHKSEIEKWWPILKAAGIKAQ
jgi:tripartite-type tricarboxylate transporter receptor subunit TctC